MRHVAAAVLLLGLSGCFETEDWFGPRPAVGLPAAPLAFTAVEGGADPADQTFLLTNTGAPGSVLAWAAAPSAPWFSVLPSTGTLAAGASILLTVHVDADYQTQAWEGPTSLGSAPVARSAHSAAFVGGQMIVWAGSDQAAPDTQLTSGGRYDPGSDTWLGTTSTASMPTERHLHAAVSTGTEMLVWGGWKFGVGFFNGGGRYAPDAWSGLLSTAGAPAAREAHTAVWTGTRMVVWGGWDGAANLDSGGHYNPAGDAWTGATTTTSVPAARQEHVAVWTGSRMVVWGGRNGPSAASSLDTGALYDAGGDAWTGATAAPGGVLSARTAAHAVWTGREMIVWGGRDAGGALDTGGRYDPGTNTWLAALSTTGAPAARWSHKAVWTGSRMVVWGGSTAVGVSVNSGGIWRPPIPALGLHAETLTISAAGVASGSLGVNLSVTP